MKLTEKKIVYILKNKLIDQCTKKEKEQFFKFAFGEKFMKSKNKGEKVKYETN